MAKHFKQGTEETTVAPRPQATRRQAQVAKSGDTAAEVSVPYGDVATYRYSYPRAVRTDDWQYEEDEDFARGGIYRVGRGIMLLLAWPVRLMAIALFVTVMLNAMPIPTIDPYVLTFTDLVTSYLPWHGMRVLAVDTPFSGAFRCDLCLLSLFLFVLDWLLCRMRAALV